MSRITTLSIILLLAIGTLMSCSGGGADVPIFPAEERTQAMGTGSHQVLGLYQFTADPVNKTLDVEPIRSAEFHINALPFLEPPPFVNLSLESLEFNGDMIEADIGLRHPFLGLTEFTGFDVCGILITNGSYTGFGDPDIHVAGPGDTYLANADGHSRWWNPTEFPVNTGTMFGYNDGLLGTPNSVAHFNSTVNGYKYFCDDLKTPVSPMTDVTQELRGMFSAGQKSIRHYSIQLGSAGLIFNYAVDACWEFPQGSKPYEPPDDFGINANRTEPWFIDLTEINNSLYYYEGEGHGVYEASIDVYDWHNPGGNSVYIEALGGFPKVLLDPTGSGEGYSTYEVEIDPATPSAAGDLIVLVTVESEEENFQGFIPGENTSAYYIHRTTVSDEPISVHTVTGIFPAHGKPDYSLEDVEVYGTGFMGGTSLAVTLEMTGEPDIAATNVLYKNSATLICDLNITPGATPGLRDVRVINGDGTSAKGDELFEVFDCGKMIPSSTGGYIITSPPGTMFGEWCGVTCSREGDSYLIATGPIHNTFAAIKATASSGSSEFQAPAGGYLEYDLACTGDNIIYYTHTGNPSMIFQIPFDPSTGFGSYSTFASIGSEWMMHRVCVDDDDNPIVLADEIATYNVMKIMHWNGSGWDQIDLPKAIIGPGDKYVQDFDYNPVLDQYVFICIDGSEFFTNMFVMDRNGEVVHQEYDVFDWNHDETWFSGIYIDQDEPGCRIFVWGGIDWSAGYNLPRPSARYDAFYGGKVGDNMPTTFNHGPGGPKGAWAPGTNRLFTPAMGGNVISWFTLPSDW